MINKRTEELYNNILKAYPDEISKMDENEILDKYLPDYFEHEIRTALFKAKEDLYDFDLLK